MYMCVCAHAYVQNPSTERAREHGISTAMGTLCSQIWASQESGHLEKWSTAEPEQGKYDVLLEHLTPETEIAWGEMMYVCQKDDAA